MTTITKTNIDTGFVTTEDNIKIAYNHYQSGHDTVLILAHGWFMSKDSRAFTEIAEQFENNYNVITFDFRGHCKSNGLYSFGHNETKDLSAIVDYAKANYKHIYLMGFSLGSLISIDYCANNDNIENLILVSAPIDFRKIENNVFSPNAFIPTLKKFEFKRWTSIQFTHPFKQKPVPIEQIDKITIPTLFIGGEKDPIIRIWHNHELFERAIEPKKELIVKGGKHAEDIYLENKELFVKVCLEWFRGEF